jgi:predicted CoA-substrate-specific enzyme activase
MYTIGIDIGSITTKAALLKDDKIVDTIITFSGYNSELTGKKIFDDIIEKNSLKSSQIKRIVSTGYGRNNVKFADKTITEISCHAAGAHFLNPEVRTVIDIGGQDSKALIINKEGKVKDFIMNDKCAAGTGRFLEVMARALESDLDTFGDLSLNAEIPAKISSTCTVFAESEVISLISRGETRENIIAGIHDSIASRISAMVKRIGLSQTIMMTGGVAKNKGIVKALEIKLKTKIEVKEFAQVNGAIGAAKLAQNLK